MSRKSNEFFFLKIFLKISTVCWGCGTSGNKTATAHEEPAYSGVPGNTWPPKETQEPLQWSSDNTP